jgi:prolyl-tRNA synthetase
MRQSQLFTKALKTASKDDVALNAQLLTRAGFIYKNSAGVYSFLPLGWRVIRNISNIVREEMDAIGGQELLMAALHDKHYLKASGRWDVDVVYKVISGEDKDPSFNISWTHEEVMTEIATKYLNSYKDLPFAAYQIQTKFRHESRAKSGLLRGREFLMKDMYSFHASEEDLYVFYARVAEAYQKAFARCGLKSYYTLAAGGDFTVNNTHEFQVEAAVGEDTVYVCDKCDYAENKEISKLKDGDACAKQCGGTVKEIKAIEVGNIFPLGTKYSKVFGLTFANAKGEKEDVVMGSYGIGISRLMGVIVEKYNDENGILWPESVAPFAVHLLALGAADGSSVYESLQKAGVQVLYDDREVTPGAKFAEADLIGIPWRIVVSAKLQAEGGDTVELKKRTEKAAKIVTLEEALKIIKKS